jgi:hypothetical protein
VTRIGSPDPGIYDDYVGVLVWEARGRYVAYRADSNEREGVTVWTRVLDVRRGRLVVNVPSYTGAWEPRVDTAPAQSDHELLANGTVAWTTQLPPVAGGIREVRYARPGARPSDPPVASGTGIEPGSLALNNRYIYWTQDATPRSARLKPLP